MKTTDQVIAELVAVATVDDVTFPMVIDAVRDLATLPPGAEGMARVLSLVGVLLDRGFIPVTSPYSTPASVPWPETTKPAVLQRLARELAAIQSEPHDCGPLLVSFHGPVSGLRKTDHHRAVR